MRAILKFVSLPQRLKTLSPQLRRSITRAQGPTYERLLGEPRLLEIIEE